MDPLRTPFLPPTPALVSLALFLARGPPLRDELPIRTRASRVLHYFTDACTWAALRLALTELSATLRLRAGGDRIAYGGPHASVNSSLAVWLIIPASRTSDLPESGDGAAY